MTKQADAVQSSQAVKTPKLKKTVTLSLSTSDMLALEEHAAKERRSFSAQLSLICENFLKTKGE